MSLFVVKMLKKLSLSAAGNEKNWPLFVLTNYLLILTHVIFHPANPGSRQKRYEAALQLRDNPIIKEAFDTADLSEISGAKKLVFMLLRDRKVSAVRLAINVRQRQNQALAKE